MQELKKRGKKIIEVRAKRKDCLEEETPLASAAPEVRQPRPT
jgi:hypothetical protein